MDFMTTRVHDGGVPFYTAEHIRLEEARERGREAWSGPRGPFPPVRNSIVPFRAAFDRIAAHRTSSPPLQSPVSTSGS